jgi:hypothetical protein
VAVNVIHKDPSLGPNDPQTHVLVVGVGSYSHVVGGRAFDPATPLTAGLTQLTSAVPSAEAFARWIIDHLDNPAAPLGTVAVVLSPGTFTDSQGAAHTVDSATFAGIKRAFNDWNARCDESADNVAILYFCGHGLESSKVMLLPEDFGASPNQLGDEIIDFTSTWYAMGECRAKSQLYLLDSCREKPLEIIRGLVVPRPLKSTTKMQFPPRDARVLHAAPLGQQAHAPQNAVSYFTRHLIHCFDKIGGFYRNGKVWDVTTDMLASAMVLAMQRAVDSGDAPVLCTSGGAGNFTTVIHQISHLPEVMCDIGCDPVAALPLAELSALQGGATIKRRGQSAATWKVDLPAGAYDLRAQFPSGQYAGGAESVIVAPPFSKESIPVR